MKEKAKLKLSLGSKLCESLGIDENTTFETYFENGSIIVSVIEDEPEEIDCIGCPYYCTTCGNCTLDE